MPERWKSALDIGTNICVLFTDLSKALETLDHDLLLAKLKAYRYSINALNLICSYLKDPLRTIP